MNIVFLSQGPAFEASSAPFRLLKNYACRTERIAQECRFAHSVIPTLLDRAADPDRYAYTYAEQVLALDPDLLALSLYCWNTSNLLRIARFCKSVRPSLQIVAGGPDTYGRGRELLLENPFLDVVIDGEGEYSFTKVVEFYLTGRASIEPAIRPLIVSLQKNLRSGSLYDIPFVSYRSGDKVERSANEFYLSDLDEIPSPILGEPAEALTTRFYVEEHGSVIVETSRGCPVNCAFCQYPKNNDGKMRYFSVDRVMSELGHIQSVGIRLIYFGDGIFTIRKERAEQLFRHFLGGQMALARELSCFYAPTVNSYKRYQSSTFAPTRIAWGPDNRTCGFRVGGQGASLRIENRIPGADANPYLAFAATIAAGLHGIENKIEPPTELKGNAYESNVQPVPKTLTEAIGLMEGSKAARKAFGEEVFRHYLHAARAEQAAFDRAVTCWERERNFERI